MSLPPILSYGDVLAETDEHRHLLLGNGFSIACRPDLFRYDKLFDRADFSKLKRAKEAFDRLKTTNFEAVIRALRNFALLSDLYSSGDGKAKERALNDADALREVLVNAVAGSHPDRPHEIDINEYVNCRKFLRPFKSINTLNYDLLLDRSLLMSSKIDYRIEGLSQPQGSGLPVLKVHGSLNWLAGT